VKKRGNEIRQTARERLPLLKRQPAAINMKNGRGSRLSYHLEVALYGGRDRGIEKPRVVFFSSSLSDPPILPADKNVARDSTGFSSGASLFAGRGA